MKLRNKKTGDIVRVEFLNNYQSDDGTEIGFRVANTLNVYSYSSLAELNTEWEDYEETKECYWYIEDNGVIQRSCHYEDLHPTLDKARKDIGNYFGTRTEAEKAVEKLEAYKRLKDKGFRSLGYYHRLGETKSKGEIGFEMDDYEATKQDLDLLFGGDE